MLDERRKKPLMALNPEHDWMIATVARLQSHSVSGNTNDKPDTKQEIPKKETNNAMQYHLIIEFYAVIIKHL